MFSARQIPVLAETESFSETVVEGKEESSFDTLAQVFNPLTRLGERVAAIEAKYEGLKSDTSSIRSTLHDTHNRMQEFVAMERQCATNLERLSLIQVNVSEQVTKLATAVEVLISAKARGEGALWASIKIITLIAAVTSGLAVVLGGLGWALEHLTFNAYPK